MAQFASLMEVQKQAVTIDDIFTKINKRWDKIYTKHQDEVVHIIDVAHTVHMAFYDI